MGRIRLCHLITELAPAGAERMVYELATRIDRDRFEPHVAALRGGRVADELRDAGVDVTVFDVRCKADLPRLLTIRRFFRRQRFDLVHTHLFHADLAAGLAGVHRVSRLVHTVHVAERRRRPMHFVWARRAARHRERLIAVSPTVRDFHADRCGIDPSKYVVIPNGVDPARYARDEQARRRLRDEWGVADNTVVIACVARLSEEKGIDVLIEAAGEMTTSPFRIVIAGDGPLREPLRRQCLDRVPPRRVAMLGFVDDVPALLSAADAFVLPSRWEGFGLAAVEAMAAGLPVVATAVEGPGEIVLDGQTGLLIPPDDPEALGSALMRVVEDPPLRKRWGRRGRERAALQYDIARAVRAHEELYLDVMETPSAG